MNTVLVTGNAGFIGMHVSLRLQAMGYTVVGVDNLNDYYAVSLKEDRLREQGIDQHCLDGRLHWGREGIGFQKADLAEVAVVENLFKEIKPDAVIHLAAQAGVRYSIDRPEAYIHSNIVGFFNILEACRHNAVKHLVYASSSSVYGLNKTVPFTEDDHVDHPISLYAATKKSNELMAHTYSHLFNIPTTGLRFFTVYGPWGRPDMALYMFTRNILEGKPINVYNNGNMSRDFTYIDDIVDGVIRSLMSVPERTDVGSVELSPAASSAPFRVYNIGRNAPVSLDEFIRCIQDSTGKKAIRNNMPIQPGDVERTFADVLRLSRDTGYAPQTTVREGVENFVRWYQGYYDILN